MERIKMSRKDRAKQFAPFDALKGLQDALRIKEYEHERVQRGELQEEKANEISKTLISLEKDSVAKITYFVDGHYLDTQGKVKLIIEENLIQVGDKKIDLNEVFDIIVINRWEKS